jgi:serine/threonine protein phosphatase PrpC
MNKIKFCGITDKGKVRSNNEDNLIVQTLWDEQHVLGVAIDGIGGSEGGELAAAIARETILEYLVNYSNGERMLLLQQAVTEANNKIFTERSNSPELLEMGCVLTACLIELDRKKIHMAHIGDSRMYQFHNGNLNKLSHDHSYVGYQEEFGNFTEEEAMNHPRRNEVTRSLGHQKHRYDDKDFIDANTFNLLPNTVLLICSDGLTDLVTKKEIIEVLDQPTSLQERAQLLIDKANQKGGTDNITVILIDYQSSINDIESGSTILNTNIEKTLIQATVHRKASKKWVHLAVVILLAFILSEIRMSFTNKHTSELEEIDIEETHMYKPKDTLSNINTKRIASPFDTTDLADSVETRYYIQTLIDVINEKEAEIVKLKSAIKALIEDEFQ